MRIGGIDVGTRVIVVAEIGGNHEGDFEKAKYLVREAAEAGADAVKFQIYQAERLVRSDQPALGHVRANFEWQVDRFRSLELSPAQYRELAALANELGLIFFASAFDTESVDLTDQVSPVIKVASGDVTDLPLLRYIAQKRKPVILSTGMADENEISQALDALNRVDVALLHCVSRYPTPTPETNLRSIPYIRDRFGIPVGYSDHTIGNLACLTAVALGASIIEKHFTYDIDQQIGDHRLSADPADLKRLVEDIRSVEKALGNYDKVMTEQELAMRTPMRRSLVAKEDIPKGSVLQPDMFVSLRPADGLAPGRIQEIIGKRSSHTIPKGKSIQEADTV